MAVIDQARIYLRESDGDPEYFMAQDHQRLGQRFFNALNENDKWVLRNSNFDCFNSNNDFDVRASIAFLQSFGGS